MSRFRRHFDYDVQAASDEAAVGNFGPSLTVQSQAEDADINVLMRRYGLLGEMPQGVRVPEYGDFEGITDYQSALDALNEVRRNFDIMPAEARARFQNDPAAFYDFCTAVAPDGKSLLNIEEMRRLKLAIPAAPTIIGANPGDVPPGK